MMINYAAAEEFADVVRAFVIVESAENPAKIGDDGLAFGLLQMHPGTFKAYYGRVSAKFAPAALDSWATAQIKACATFLYCHGWLNAGEAQRDLIVQAWNVGETGVFVEGKRNPEYLARWLAAYDSIQKHTVRE